MSPLEHNTQRQGLEVHKTGPIPVRFLVKFAAKTFALLLSAALVLADIPGFGS